MIDGRHSTLHLVVHGCHVGVHELILIELIINESLMLMVIFISVLVNTVAVVVSMVCWNHDLYVELPILLVVSLKVLRLIRLYD